MYKGDRLRHPRDAFLRKMQMSSIEMYVFVEGTVDDSFFFGSICGEVAGRRPFTYEVCAARELRGSGGKASLITFYEYQRRRGSLCAEFKGKVTASVFFLDKDLDDVLRRSRRSPHVVYTRHYDIQNYIYNEGDLVKGASVAASLDPAILKAHLSDARRWCRSAAIRWKEWVTLCLFAITQRVRCECNYRVASMVNTPLTATADASAVEARRVRLQAAAGLGDVEFRGEFALISQRVESYYATNDHDVIFKGKWYALLLDGDIKAFAGPKPYNSNGLASRLTSAIEMSLDFSSPWAEHLRQPLEAVLDMLRGISTSSAMPLT